MSTQRGLAKPMLKQKQERAPHSGEYARGLVEVNQESERLVSMAKEENHPNSHIACSLFQGCRGFSLWGGRLERAVDDCFLWDLDGGGKGDRNRR